VPQQGSRLFNAKLDDTLKQIVTYPNEMAGLDSNKDYLYPRAEPANSQTLVTAYDHTSGKSALYRISSDPTTAPDVSSFVGLM
jgi:hypothetical protein